MRIIPVLDLKNGIPVHAVGGHREHYAPLQTRLLHGVQTPQPARPESNPSAQSPQGWLSPASLARCFRQELNLGELYLADLDAIAGHARNRLLYQQLRQEGLSLWLDPGIRSPELAVELRDLTDVLILGLESLSGLESLRTIVDQAGADRLAFSLDLRQGEPILASGSSWPDPRPRALVEFAIELGIKRVILLDLACVGRGQGVGTLELLRGCATAGHGVDWVIGGGLATIGQVQEAGQLGATAALVGSALHDGRIGAVEIASLNSPRVGWSEPRE